jgi:glycogen synthase
VDVLLEALPQILSGGSKAQVVVLGTGKQALEQKVAQMEAQFPSSAKGVVEFNGVRRVLCSTLCVAETFPAPREGYKYRV